MVRVTVGECIVVFAGNFIDVMRMPDHDGNGQ